MFLPNTHQAPDNPISPKRKQTIKAPEEKCFSETPFKESGELNNMTKALYLDLGSGIWFVFMELILRFHTCLLPFPPFLPALVEVKRPVGGKEKVLHAVNISTNTLQQCSVAGCLFGLVSSRSRYTPFSFMYDLMIHKQHPYSSWILQMIPLF